MKKPLTLILLLAFIVPQITLAAWYNPLDWSVWNIFKKKGYKDRDASEEG